MKIKPNKPQKKQPDSILIIRFKYYLFGYILIFIGYNFANIIKWDKVDFFNIIIIFGAVIVGEMFTDIVLHPNVHLVDRKISGIKKVLSILILFIVVVGVLKLIGFDVDSFLL